MGRFLTAMVCLAVACRFAAADAGSVTFSGSVRDSNGQPAAGADVIAIARGIHPSASAFELRQLGKCVTGPDGAFALRVTPDSAKHEYACFIIAKKDGLALDWTTAFFLPGISQYPPLVLILRDSATLSGIVTDEAGAPIAGAQVRVLLGKSDEASASYTHELAAPDWLSARTDAQGRFSFADMPADARAEFVVSAPGRETMSTRDAQTATAELHFKPGQKDIVVKLLKEAVIRGRVIEKGVRRPVGGVRLVALRQRRCPELPPLLCASNEEGKFEIRGLSAGDYTNAVVSPVENVASWVAEPFAV